MRSIIAVLVGLILSLFATFLYDATGIQSFQTYLLGYISGYLITGNSKGDD